MKTLNVTYNNFTKSTKYEGLNLVYFLEEVTDTITGIVTTRYNNYLALSNVRFKGLKKGDLVEITLEEAPKLKSAKGNNYLVITKITKVSTTKEEASEASQELKETLGLR